MASMYGDEATSFDNNTFSALYDDEDTTGSVTAERGKGDRRSTVLSTRYHADGTTRRLLYNDAKGLVLRKTGPNYVPPIFILLHVEKCEHARRVENDADNDGGVLDVGPTGSAAANPSTCDSNTGHLPPTVNVDGIGTANVTTWRVVMENRQAVCDVLQVGDCRPLTVDDCFLRFETLGSLQTDFARCFPLPSGCVGVLTRLGFASFPERCAALRLLHDNRVTMAPVYTVNAAANSCVGTVVGYLEPLFSQAVKYGGSPFFKCGPNRSASSSSSAAAAAGSEDLFTVNIHVIDDPTTTASANSATAGTLRSAPKDGCRPTAITRVRQRPSVLSACADGIVHDVSHFFTDRSPSRLKSERPTSSSLLSSSSSSAATLTSLPVCVTRIERHLVCIVCCVVVSSKATDDGRGTREAELAVFHTYYCWNKDVFVRLNKLKECTNKTATREPKLPMEWSLYGTETTAAGTGRPSAPLVRVYVSVQYTREGDRAKAVYQMLTDAKMCFWSPTRDCYVRLVLGSAHEVKTYTRHVYSSLAGLAYNDDNDDDDDAVSVSNRRPRDDLISEGRTLLQSRIAEGVADSKRAFETPADVYKNAVSVDCAKVCAELDVDKSSFCEAWHYLKSCEPTFGRANGDEMPADSGELSRLRSAQKAYQNLVVSFVRERVASLLEEMSDRLNAGVLDLFGTDPPDSMMAACPTYDHDGYRSVGAGAPQYHPRPPTDSAYHPVYAVNSLFLHCLLERQVYYGSCSHPAALYKHLVAGSTDATLKDFTEIDKAAVVGGETKTTDSHVYRPPPAFLLERGLFFSDETGPHPPTAAADVSSRPLGGLYEFDLKSSSASLAVVYNVSPETVFITDASACKRLFDLRPQLRQCFHVFEHVTAPYTVQNDDRRPLVVVLRSAVYRACMPDYLERLVVARRRAAENDSPLTAFYKRIMCRFNSGYQLQPGNDMYAVQCAAAVSTICHLTVDAVVNSLPDPTTVLFRQNDGAIVTCPRLGVQKAIENAIHCVPIETEKEPLAAAATLTVAGDNVVVSMKKQMLRYVCRDLDMAFLADRTKRLLRYRGTNGRVRVAALGQTGLASLSVPLRTVRVLHNCVGESLYRLYGGVVVDNASSRQDYETDDRYRCHRVLSAVFESVSRSVTADEAQWFFDVRVPSHVYNGVTDEILKDRSNGVCFGDTVALWPVLVRNGDTWMRHNSCRPPASGTALSDTLRPDVFSVIGPLLDCWTSPACAALCVDFDSGAVVVDPNTGRTCAGYKRTFQAKVHEFGQR